MRVQKGQPYKRSTKHFRNKPTTWIENSLLTYQSFWFWPGLNFWNFELKNGLMASSSQCKLSHQLSSLLISFRLFVTLLESNGSFLKSGQSCSSIFIRKGKGKACRHILSKLGRDSKRRTKSLENISIFSSISPTPNSSPIISPNDSQKTNSRVWILRA